MRNERRGGNDEEGEGVHCSEEKMVGERRKVCQEVYYDVFFEACFINKVSLFWFKCVSWKTWHCYSL